MVRCQCLNANGEQCQREVTKVPFAKKQYCWQHQSCHQSINYMVPHEPKKPDTKTSFPPLKTPSLPLPPLTEHKGFTLPMGALSSKLTEHKAKDAPLPAISPKLVEHKTSYSFTYTCNTTKVNQT